MRAKSTRIILLTDYPEVENPGGTIVPGASTILRRGVSERTMLWNMQKDSEVEGTVEINRSILWDVQAGGGPLLTNYIEFPFFHQLVWRADPDVPGFEFALTYRGIVRLWESGTLQMAGEAIFQDTNIPGGETELTEISYKVWSGGSPGQLHTVVTIPTDEQWYPVNFAAKAGVGEHWEIFYGGIPEEIGSPQNRVELLQYPHGIVMPPDPPHVWGGSGGSSAVTACGLVRDGDAIDGDWAVTPGVFTTQHWGWTWELDSSDFSSDNFIEHFNQSTLGGSISGSFTRTIPDSATVGLRIHIGSAAGNRTTGTFDVGPIFRPAYATPTIQQGVDPIP